MLFSRAWWRVIWSDRGKEDFNASVLVHIWFGPPLPRAFYLAFGLSLPTNILAARSLRSLQVAAGSSSAFSPPIPRAVAFSEAAQDSYLAGLLSKPDPSRKHPPPAEVRHVTPNPLYPLAGSQLVIPKTDRHAQLLPEAPYYNDAKAVRLARHAELCVHSWVDAPPGVLICRTQWVFDIKQCPDTGMVLKFKARIVADGKPQIPGIHCHGTHSTTASIQQIKIQLIKAARLDLDLFHLDTTTAFLYGELPDGAPKQYCYPPPDVRAPMGTNGRRQVWLLHKSLEGTRSASKCWQVTSSKVITDFGFTPLGPDGTLWKFDRTDVLDDGTATHCTMTMNTHVDDFLVSVKPASFFCEFCKYYSQFFASTYGVASEFVGLHIVRDRERRRIYIDQTLLIERILDQHYDGIMEREGLKGNDRQHVHGRSRYDQLCPVSTPFDYKNPTLDAADCLAEPDPAAVHLVQVVNGLFQYLVITRLDLIFAKKSISSHCTQSCSCSYQGHGSCSQVFSWYHWVGSSP